MIHEHSREQLAEIRNLLNQLTDDLLCRPLQVLDGSTIGMHFRHILEFYQCLFQALEGGKLNYDLRKRERDLEVSVPHCLKRLEHLAGKLEDHTVDLPLLLYADTSKQGHCESLEFTTTFYRELLYNIEHCVHHLAIIKIGLKSLDNPSIKIEPEMGVAASTLRNKAECAP